MASSKNGQPLSPIETVLARVSSAAPTKEELLECTDLIAYAEALQTFENSLRYVISALLGRNDFGTKQAVKNWLQTRNDLCLPLLAAIDREAAPLKLVMERMIKYPVVMNEETSEIIVFLETNPEAYEEINELALAYADSINDIPSTNGQSPKPKVVCIPHKRVRAELCADLVEQHIDKIMIKSTTMGTLALSLPDDVPSAKEAGDVFIRKILNPLVAEHAGSNVRTCAEQVDVQQDDTKSPIKLVQAGDYMRYARNGEIKHLDEFQINSYNQQEFDQCHDAFMEYLVQHDVHGRQLEYVEGNITKTLLGLIQHYPRMFIRPLYLHSRYEVLNSVFTEISQLANRSTSEPVQMPIRGKTSVL